MAGQRPTGNTPFIVHCEACRHEWTAAYTPMPLATFAKLGKGLHCPKCGTDGRQIFSGPAPKKPTEPLNRVLREGETPCTVCGSGRANHDKRDHTYTRRPLPTAPANTAIRKGVGGA